MDPPFALRLGHASNEGERSTPQEIIEQSEEIPTDAPEMDERMQTRKASASAEARGRLDNQATVYEISEAIKDTLSGMNKPISARITTQMTPLCPICPIHRLPPEVLCPIFQYCQYGKPHYTKMKTALLLAFVCRYWRGVACSFGDLWRYIGLYRRSKGLNIDDKCIKLFINRSYSGLELYVDAELLDYLFDGPIPRDRVHQLELWLSDNPYYMTPFHSCSVMLPNLTHLNVNASVWGRAQMLCGDFLSQTPSLEDLDIRDISLYFSKDIKLANLRRIYWKFDGETSETMLIDLCSRAPHLQSVELYVEPTPAQGMAVGPWTELSAIQTDCNGLIALGRLITPLVMPSLRHLTFICRKRLEPVWRLYQVDDLLHRPPLVSLTRLSLILDPFHDCLGDEALNYQLDCLFQLQHVTRLDIMGMDRYRYSGYHPIITHMCHLLSLCTPKPSLPSLQAVHFVGKIKVGVPLDGVIQMARERAALNGITKLERIIFEECETLTIDQYRQLRNALGQNEL